jgi:hypothetical protein
MQIQLKNIKDQVNLEVHWPLPFAYTVLELNPRNKYKPQAVDSGMKLHFKLQVHKHHISILDILKMQPQFTS